MHRHTIFFIARIAIFAAFSLICIVGYGQFQSTRGTITDVVGNGAEGAIGRMVDQGIIPLMSKDKYEPSIVLVST
jgi:hypothetical protein